MINEEKFDHVSKEISNLFDGVGWQDATMYKSMISAQLDHHQMTAIIRGSFGVTFDQTKENDE